jgi:hypothetical protein
MIEINPILKKQGGNNYIPTKFKISEKLLDKAFDILLNLRSSDFIIRTNVISVMQGLKKDQVPKILSELFLDLDRRRKSFSQESYYQLLDPVTSPGGKYREVILL